MHVGPDQGAPVFPQPVLGIVVAGWVDNVTWVEEWCEAYNNKYEQESARILRQGRIFRLW